MYSGIKCKGSAGQWVGQYSINLKSRDFLGEL